MIAQRSARPSTAVVSVVRAYRERAGHADPQGAVLALPGRPAHFLEIYLEAPYRVSIDGEPFAETAEAVVVGPSSRHRTRLLITGSIRTFQIAFQPAGFNRLFGVGMDHLADTAAPVRALASGPLESLVDLVRLARDFDARVLAADAWLARRLAWSRAAEPVDHLARLIRRAKGAPKIAEVAARLDLSPRQLQRRFIQQVGLPPKLYARTVRFDAVLEARARNPDLTWTALAQHYGYFDQAHLLRDAYAFTGQAPGALTLET